MGKVYSDQTVPPDVVASASDTLFSVKLLRICFVVLLAVLLPIRGAMAAVMPCAPSSGISQAEMHVQSAVVDPADGHQHHTDSVFLADAVDALDHFAHDHGDQPAPSHDHATQKCNMCSASCSIPPMPAASAGLTEPTVLTEASYPDYSAPATTFQSDGQERPPRTI